MQFFPKNEKYVSLFTGGENSDTVEKRNKWRQQIKDNLMEAAASGKELEGQLLYLFGFLCELHNIPAVYD